MVPISYDFAQKFLERLQEEPDLQRQNRSAISLPMAFEIRRF